MQSIKPTKKNKESEKSNIFLGFSTVFWGIANKKNIIITRISLPNQYLVMENGIQLQEIDGLSSIYSLPTFIMI